MAAPVDLGIAGLDPATRIGEGGNATVYRARQPELDREVAVKVLKQADEDTLRRFARERRAMGRLGEHDGIVSVYSTGVAGNGHPYLVMPLLGDDLADELARHGPLPWQEAVRVMRDVCATVQAAHEQGVVHRDLKPGNLIRARNGRVLVADFGIARVTSGATSLRSTSVSLTPTYSPPEAFDDGEASVTSDVYSLGATLHALLTGRPPFVGPGESVSILVLIKRINERPVDPIGPPVPPAINDILRLALAKAPHERFATAGAMANALGAIDLDGAGAVTLRSGERPVVPAPTPATQSSPALHTPTIVNPTVPPDPVPRTTRRGSLVGVLAVGLAAVVAIGAFVLTRDSPSTTAEPDTTIEETVPPTEVAPTTEADVDEPDPQPEETDPPPVDPGPLGPAELGPPERVSDFRLERIEDDYAIGVDPTDGDPDLVVVDRFSLDTVARAPLGVDGTNTAEAVVPASGHTWIFIAGRNEIDVFVPACSCIDRTIQLESGEGPEMVAVGSIVWSVTGDGRIVGRDDNGVIVSDVASPTGPGSTLWVGRLDGQLVIVGDGVAALFDAASRTFEAVFDVDVEGVARTDEDIGRIHWTVPSGGTLHTLDGAGASISRIVGAPGMISQPVYDPASDLVWVADADDLAILGLDPIELTEQSRYELGVEPSLADPKLAAGRIWFSVAGEILALDPADGSIDVRLEVGGPGFVPFDVIEQQLWVLDPNDITNVDRYDILL